MRKLLLIIMSVAWTGLLAGSQALAQRQFSPESPEVRAVVDRALAYLNSAKPKGEKGVLAGLAIAEASKRYQRSIPDNNPVINSAVAEIVKGVKSGKLLKEHAVYHPCLATILLCEVDDVEYRPQIIKLLKSFEDRQLDNGGFAYLGDKVWDTSQTQYVALAYYVARQHKIPVSINSTRKILEFLIGVQAGNTWVYSPHETGLRISIHAAASGTAYLLGDLLQLQPRLKIEKKIVSGAGYELPPSISIYVEETTTEEESEADNSAWNAEGPLAKINAARFKACKAGANSHFETAFVLKAPAWSYYYLYAFERYAFFRTQAEGDVGGRAMASWFDDGFKLFRDLQQENGALPKGPEPAVTSEINTSFAIMFMVRSSEILSLPPAGSELAGGKGLSKLSGKKLKKQVNGQIQAERNSKDLNALLKDLGQDLSDDQLEDLADSIKDAISEYQNRPEKSRGSTRAFLKSLVKDPNYFKRLIAVEFLAGEQDLDNAPALIYALGDPDIRVCIEAHNGLRLISRKIDSISVPENPALADFVRAKVSWTNWLLELRPDANLLD